MDAVSTATQSVSQAQASLEFANKILAEGYVSAETITARDTAAIQAEAQVNILKQAIEAETLLVDLIA